MMNAVRCGVRGAVFAYLGSTLLYLAAYEGICIYGWYRNRRDPACRGRPPLA